MIGPSDIVAMHDGWCVTCEGDGVRHLRPVTDGVIGRSPTDTLAVYHQSEDGRWWGVRRDIPAAWISALTEARVLEVLAAMLGLPAPACLVGA